MIFLRASAICSFVRNQSCSMSEEAEVRIGGVMLVPSANLSPNAKKIRARSLKPLQIAKSDSRAYSLDTQADRPGRLASAEVSVASLDQVTRHHQGRLYLQIHKPGFYLCDRVFTSLNPAGL